MHLMPTPKLILTSVLLLHRHLLPMTTVPVLIRLLLIQLLPVRLLRPEVLFRLQIPMKEILKLERQTMMCGFKFTATQTAHRVTLRNVSGMPRDLVVEILQGNCGNLTSMKISTSYANTVFGLTIGNTYYVRVFSESPDTGATTTFNVCLSIPPTGAICEKPIVVSGLPYTTTDNTINYGDDYDFPQGGESGCEGTNNHYLGGDETVYAYTPAANQTINIRIPGAPGWTAILVYTDCNAIGTGAIACANGDFEIGDREINELAVTAGTTYYILLSTQPAPQSFAYTLNITEESLGTKPFDDSSFRAYLIL